MTDKPFISIVVVTFNSEYCVKDCLFSIYSQDPRADVVVVDNNSADNTARVISEAFPWARLIRNNKNLGACKARNQGIDSCSGEWVLTLDCDCRLGEGFMQKMAYFLEALPDNAGMIQPKIVMADKRTIYSCGIYLSRFFNRFYDIGKGEPDSNASCDKKITGVCSAAALYRRKMLDVLKEPTGYFDERFFFLAEDVDLSWRASKKGWNALFFPEAVCFHDGNSSSSSRHLRQFLCFRNRFYSIKKNSGLSAYFLKAIPVLFYDIPRAVYMLLTNPLIYKPAKNRI